MNIFLSVSYSSEISADGSVNAAYRHDLEAVIAVLEEAGHKVFCAPRTDNWILKNVSPSEGFNQDIDEILKSDVIVALIGEKISAGQQFELGFAFHAKKRLILAHKADVKLPYIDQGLVDQPDVSDVAYENIQTLHTDIVQHLELK
ncbi:MAG: hypothetical protein JWS12_396 [Candidatus Saccharibacteria bacterium]|nr:hypothetical protein [Candidatus Saccharibacteria bacterium]